MQPQQSLIERYRERAAHFRTMAAEVPEHKERALLLKLAEDYDALAATVSIIDSANRPFTAP